MASAQVDATHVEEFTKPSEETTFESQGPEKAPTPPQNIKSPYDDDDDDDENDIALPDELGKEEDLDDDDDKDEKAPEPHIIEDEDEDDDDDENDGAQAEERVSKSGSRATDFSEEDDD